MSHTLNELVESVSFWRTSTPFERAFMRSIGTGTRDSRDTPSENEGRWDLISETGFQIKRLGATTMMEEVDILIAAERIASEKISKLKGGTSGVLSEDELNVSLSLAESISALTPAVGQDAEAIWSPAVPGLGRLGESEADLLIGDTVVEIKNVGRAFSVRDVRQSLIYATSLSISNAEINRFSLLNARLYTVIVIPLQDAAVRLSGRSWVSLRADIADFLQRGGGDYNG